MACNPNKIIAALHEEKENVRDIVRIKIKTATRLAIQRVRDGGVVARSSNQETIIYGEANQASMAYKSLDHDPRALVSGNMQGRTLSGQNGIFGTNLNSIDDNSCHGFCTINFAQGYRRRGFEDYGIDVDTPIMCARELDRLPRARIEGFFDGLRRQFTRFGFQNFDDNLLNLVIKNGEANASVQGAAEFSVTKGGWQAPPVNRLSVWFLLEYRRYLMREMEMLDWTVPEDWLMEIEVPQEDAFDAIQEHQIRRNSMLTGGVPMMNYQGKILEDPRDKLKGRSYVDYLGIRFLFNDRPIRGYFKQIGTTGGQPNYQFTRVYHWKNVAGEEGGLVLDSNPAYDEARINVDGVFHDMVTLAPHIDPRSFIRYRLEKPLKPDGERNMSVNYDVEVVDGAYIPNNIQNDKFGFAARHEFRFKTIYPEVSGVIAYRHGRLAGYVLPVVNSDLTPGPDRFSGPEQFRECDLIDPVTVANCAVCGEVPTSEGNCIAAGSAALGVIGLVPAGAVLTDYLGAPSTVRIAVRRTGELARAASVNYTVTAGTATAGTHFTAVGSTVLNFAAGQEYAFINVAIIGGTGNPASDVTCVVTISSPTGATLKTGATVTTITINDPD